MFKVYILQSLTKKDKTYVGQTIKPIEIRVNEHNQGLSTYTKSDKQWIVIYYETFYCKTCTDKREQFLKSGVGYKFRKIILQNYGKIE